MKTRNLLTVLLLFSSIVIYAQKLTISETTLVSDPNSPNSGWGQLTWATGSSVTKNGYIIPFQPELKNDSIMVGYCYNRSALGSFSENDVLLLFIPKLKYHSSLGLGPGSFDDSGNKVFGGGGLNGAWKELTVSKKYREGENLVIIFTESCKLIDESVINSITFKPIKDFYIVNKTSLIE